MPISCPTHLNKTEREKQGKRLWRAFLKDQAKVLKMKSRRRQIQGGKGKEYWKGDDPEYQTDRDEFGTYDFWGAE